MIAMIDGRLHFGKIMKITVIMVKKIAFKDYKQVLRNIGFALIES